MDKFTCEHCEQSFTKVFFYKDSFVYCEGCLTTKVNFEEFDEFEELENVS